MEKELFKDEENIMLREKYLKDNCDAAETIGYTKAIPDDKLSQMKDDIINKQIEISELEEEKSQVTRDYNDKLKGMKEVRNELIGKVKHKSEYHKDLCYKFVDRDKKVTGYYDKFGDLVYERQSTPDEMQMNMFIEEKRTGTDN